MRISDWSSDVCSSDLGTVVGPHCVIDGHTSIGANNTFYRFCSIGGMPQDKKYQGEPTRLEIGDGNMVREYVTINTGTAQDVGVGSEERRVGKGCASTVRSRWSPYH